jgi:GT2 family glycosyltransferase
MYGEDQELAYRLTKQGKLRHGILTTAKITHLGSASSSSKNAILGELQGYLYFFAKYKANYLLFAQTILWWGCLVRAFVYFVQKKRLQAGIYAEGMKLISATIG